jgi:preprotein translocase subunit Sec63
MNPYEVLEIPPDATEKDIKNKRINISYSADRMRTCTAISVSKKL